ncbi:MAG TPA: 30S ribosomal protein S7 [Oligoflexia bacterium]|nr:30S ribosomal protein S7 [Oligoflexia bacterium]
MSRKKFIAKREILPDPKFNDLVVAKFINSLMVDGKKSVAEGILYSTLDILQKRTNDDPLKVFKKALENLKPVLEVKSRRVGGATYQVPVEVKPARRQSLASRWLIEFARDRAEKSIEEKLASEVLDALANRGGAMKRKDDVHRMAEANKAFAHFRW